MGIVLDNVCFKYDKNLFNNISLNINYNTICGVIGKSGSGKTTLLKLISNILKPTSGRITFDGNIKKKDIGIIFQNPTDQIFCKNVKDEISFALHNYKLNNKISDVIKLVGLKEDILNKKISELTSAEKRLVSIASILVFNPKIILFDEPTINLDYKNKKKIIQLIKTLKNRYNKTIIIVSHDIDLMYELCDNLIVISNGNIIKYDEPVNVFKDIDLLKKYDISIPKIVYFENTVKNKGIKLMNSKNINDLIKEVYRNV